MRPTRKMFVPSLAVLELARPSPSRNSRSGASSCFRSKPICVNTIHAKKLFLTIGIGGRGDLHWRYPIE